MNIKAISRNVGIALLVSALFMFFSILVSVSEGNDSALAALLISFTITFIVGIFPFIFVRRAPVITLKDGYMIIVLSWLLSFIFGMLPYLLWGGPFTVINAWFESVSGFTTTGATILERVEALPKSLLFWRSSTHFIGGIGVVVFLLLIIPQSSPVKLRLTNMELSSLSREGYRARSNKTVYIFTYVYLGMNLAAFLCYLLAGMSPFDAVNHAFSVCATGGFSTRTYSIGDFRSVAVNIVTIVFMLLSSIHFGLLYLSIITRSLRPILRNPVFKFYIRSILLFSFLVVVALRFSGDGMSWPRAIMNGVFQCICSCTTTGFAICDNSTWPFFAGILLMYLGIQCAMAGSTSGGVKSDRVLLLLKAMGRQIRQSIHPASVSGIRIGKNILKDEDVYPHVLYIGVYFSFIIISMFLCLLLGADSQHALWGSISSLGNVGPALGDIGTYGNYNAEPSTVKLIFSLDMFLGRIEIYPVLAVISMIFSRTKR